MKPLALSLALLLPLPAAALDAVELHGRSYHTKRERVWQEENWGIGGVSGLWRFGVYRNSFNRASGYLLAQKEWEIGGGFSFGGGLGYATGYWDQPNKGAVAYLSASWGPIQLRAVPPATPKHSAVFAISWVIPLEAEKAEPMPRLRYADSR